MSVIFPLALIAIGVWLLHKSADDSRLFRLVLAALALRLSFSLLNMVGIRFPFSDTTDVLAFLTHAEEMSAGDFELDVSQSYVWASVIGLINLYTGDLIVSPLVLNSLAGSFTVLFGYRISKLLFADSRRAFQAALVLAFLPPLVFLSATYLRDAAAALFLTMFVYYLLRFGLTRERPVLTPILVLLSASLAALLHGAFVLLPAFAFLYVLLRLLAPRAIRSSLAAYSIFLAVGIAVVVLFFSFDVGASKVGALYTTSSAAIGEQLSYVASIGMMREDLDTLRGSWILFTVIAVLKFLFSPFFSDQLRFFDAIRFPIVVYSFLCLCRILMDVLPNPFRRIQLSFVFLVAFLFSYFFLFSLGSLDPDTAFRHYMKLLPVIVAAGVPMMNLAPRSRGCYAISSK